MSYVWKCIGLCACTNNPIVWEAIQNHRMPVPGQLYGFWGVNLESFPFQRPCTHIQTEVILALFHPLRFTDMWLFSYRRFLVIVYRKPANIMRQTDCLLSKLNPFLQKAIRTLCPGFMRLIGNHLQCVCIVIGVNEYHSDIEVSSKYRKRGTRICHSVHNICYS